MTSDVDIVHRLSHPTCYGGECDKLVFVGIGKFAIAIFVKKGQQCAFQVLIASYPWY